MARDWKRSNVNVHLLKTLKSFLNPLAVLVEREIVPRSISIFHLYIHNLNSLCGLNAVRIAEFLPISEYWKDPPPSSHPQVIVKVEHKRILVQYNSVRRRLGCPAVQNVVVEHLAGPIFLPPQRLHNPRTIDTAFRLFYVFRRSLRRLDKYHSSLPNLEATPDARFSHITTLDRYVQSRLSDSVDSDHGDIKLSTISRPYKNKKSRLLRATERRMPQGSFPIARQKTL